MRPTLRLLDAGLIRRIVTEARDIVGTLGVEVHNPGALDLLHAHGARVDRHTARAFLPDDLVDRALASAPSSFTLFDLHGRETHDFRDDRVYFTPGSAAINILDGDTGAIRPPTTADYIRYVKVVSGLPHIASQSTAFIPADVPSGISDSYRLFLSLMYGVKPVVTGAFTIEAFEVMKNLQVAVRGTDAALAERPLAIFSCCPTAPIKWSDVTSQNVIDCARHGIPVEFVSMPLAGFMSPVTLVGSLVQHTAETLSGVVISQIARPGTPVLWGGSPAIFDIRYETTPMGAIETMMMDCAYSEIGRSLGLPTQAYISLSDAKQLDAQAGEGLLRSTRLLVQAEVAQTYLAIRALDVERALVRGTVNAYRGTLELTERRFRAGDVAELDVTRARTEVAATESEALALDRRRAELEHALAVLVGEVSSRFSLPVDEWRTALPVIPAGVPGTVLTRRPDVSAAQNGMLAAQERVGVAQAAWFPDVSLTAAGGYASPELGDLFKWSARAWGVGALLSLPVFDGGRREAGVQSALARMDEAVARYREQVLMAFRDVEDQLSSLRLLAEQAAAQTRAVDAAARTTALSDVRYRNGLVSQLDLLDARRSELRNRRQALQVRAAQYQATVGLVRALGGGWSGAS